MEWEYHWFFRDNSEKRASYWLFWPIIERSFDRIDVFWPIMCMTGGGFSWKNLKNDMRAPCSERLDIFLTKNGHQIYVFFKESTFFRQNMSETVVIFSWKIMKKGHPSDFFGQQYTDFFDSIGVLRPIMAMTTGGFPWKSWKHGPCDPLPFSDIFSMFLGHLHIKY